MSQPAPRPILSFKIGDQPVPGYRLVRELGRGTFGVVWLAVTDNGFERAIKFVNLEQRGGKKEFRALRLIKDRKILHGNLLMLVDYWLLDREGTILNTASDPGLESQIAPSSKSGAVGGKVKTEAGAQVQITNVAALHNGTMVPGEVDDAPMSVRDTFQQLRMSDTREEENSQAIWLVVAMELGHKTLHDRQKEYTAELRNKSPRKKTRQGATEVDFKGDTSPGSHTVADQHQADHEEVDEELEPLSADEVLPYMEQAARGLDHLHRCEIVHRDIKPQNIMLVGDVAKVCDYGLASELNDIRATTNAFTLPYAAPEAINKNRPTPSSDQYSLAVTYVELRTGRWPFVSNTSTAVYAAKDTGVHHLKFVPKRAVRLVLKKALAKNPADRYPTCGDFVKELNKAEHSRSSFFALAQAMLAGIAIVTVLLAALATHPDIRQRILTAIRPIGEPEPQRTAITPEKFLRDLANAEAFLAEKKFAEARDEFNSLEENASVIADLDAAARADAYLGLARTMIGETAGIKQPLSNETKNQILQLLARLDQVAGKALPDKQRVRQYFVQRALGPGTDLPIDQFEPDSALARDALTQWEVELWRTWMTPVQLTELLAELVSQRKSGQLEQAQQTYQKIAMAAMERGLADTDPFQQRIRLEKLHLDHHLETATHEGTLEELRTYIAEVKQDNNRLVDHAQLLQLLVLYKRKQGQPFSLFDGEVCLLIAGARAELFHPERADEHDFSTMEVETIAQLRKAFRNDVLRFDASLPDSDMTPVFQAVSQLFSREECLQLLMQRMRERLDSTAALAVRLPPVLAAWSDLQKFVTTAYPDDTLTATDAEEYADLSLEAAAADDKAGPGRALEFASLLRNTAPPRQVAWFERLLLKAEKETAWSGVAVPLRELANNPPLALKEDSKRWQDWEKRLAALEIRSVLHIDPVVGAAELQGRLTRLPKGGVADLLRVELEFLGDPAPASNKLEIWRGRAERAKASLAGGSTDAGLFADYLLSRLQESQGTGLSDAQVTSLLALFQRSSPPEWFTDSRQAGAKELLSLLAMKWLKLDDAEGTPLNDAMVIRFSALPPIETPRLTKLRELTAKLGAAPPLVGVIEAIRSATRGSQADWAQIHQVLTKHKDDVYAVFQKQRASRLFDYVLLMSTLKKPDAGTLDDAAVTAFDALLESTPAMGGEAYFTYAGPPTADDEGILKNIVNLALSGVGKDQSARSPEAKRALAKLWGAKGRLLQRSYNSVVVEELKQQDSMDRVSAASTVAHEAFTAARELDPANLDYAVGFGRTMLNMPPQLQSAKVLRDLQQQFDPEGKSADPGMRFLTLRQLRVDGYFHRDRAVGMKQINEAIDKLKELYESLPEEDPWQLRAPCLEALSDSHLRLAFYTPRFALEDVQALEAGQVPPAGSKPYHLYHAELYARLQKDIPDRLKPENAAIGLANAYEDYAYYLKLPKYYQSSISEFREAIVLARGQGREIGEAQMNFGRCLYRFAVDPLADRGDVAARIALHKEAEGHLREAIGPDTSLTTSNQAETRLWLAQNLHARFQLRDQDEDLKTKPEAALALIEEAAKRMGEAAELEGKSGGTYYQVMYLAIQLEKLVMIASSMRSFPADVMTPARLKAYSEQIDGVEREAFRVVSQLTDGADLRPDDLVKLAEISGYRYSTATKAWERNMPMYDRWIKDETMQALWKSTAALRYEEFLVRLKRVSELEKRGASTPEVNGELNVAKSLIAGLSDEMALYANSRLADRAVLASSKRHFELKQKAARDSEIVTAYLEDLPGLIEAKRARDAIVERDAVKSAAMKLIRSTPLASIDKLQFKLSTTDKRLLLDELNRLPDTGAPLNIGVACLVLFEQSKANKPVPGFSTLELAQLAHDTLKPYYALPASDASMAQFLAARTQYIGKLAMVEKYLADHKSKASQPATKTK